MAKLYDELTPKLIEFIDKYAERLGRRGIREGHLAGTMTSIDGLEGLRKPSL